MRFENMLMIKVKESMQNQPVTVHFINGYANQLPDDMKLRISTLLEKSMRHDEADMCALHVYDREKEELHILAQAGLSPEYMEHFKSAHPFDTSASGRAIGIGSAIIICDVNADVSYANSRQSANDAGVRAVKAMPLFWQKQKVGVIATHFRDTKYTWNLNHLDEVTTPLAEVLSAASKFIQSRNPRGFRFIFLKAFCKQETENCKVCTI